MLAGFEMVSLSRMRKPEVEVEIQSTAFEMASCSTMRKPEVEVEIQSKEVAAQNQRCHMLQTLEAGSEEGISHSRRRRNSMPRIETAADNGGEERRIEALQILLAACTQVMNDLLNKTKKQDAILKRNDALLKQMCQQAERTADVCQAAATMVSGLDEVLCANKDVISEQNESVIGLTNELRLLQARETVHLHQVTIAEQTTARLRNEHEALQCQVQGGTRELQRAACAFEAFRAQSESAMLWAEERAMLEVAALNKRVQEADRLRQECAAVSAFQACKIARDTAVFKAIQEEVIPLITESSCEAARFESELLECTIQVSQQALRSDQELQSFRSARALASGTSLLSRFFTRAENLASLLLLCCALAFFLAADLE